MSVLHKWLKVAGDELSAEEIEKYKKVLDKPELLNVNTMWGAAKAAIQLGRIDESAWVPFIEDYALRYLNVGVALAKKLGLVDKVNWRPAIEKSLQYDPHYTAEQVKKLGIPVDVDMWIEPVQNLLRRKPFMAYSIIHMLGLPEDKFDFSQAKFQDWDDSLKEDTYFKNDDLKKKWVQKREQMPFYQFKLKYPRDYYKRW